MHPQNVAVESQTADMSAEVAEQTELWQFSPTGLNPNPYQPSTNQFEPYTPHISVEAARDLLWRDLPRIPPHKRSRQKDNKTSRNLASKTMVSNTTLSAESRGSKITKARPHLTPHTWPKKEAVSNRLEFRDHLRPSVVHDQDQSRSNLQFVGRRDPCPSPEPEPEFYTYTSGPGSRGLVEGRYRDGAMERGGYMGIASDEANDHHQEVEEQDSFQAYGRQPLYASPVSGSCRLWEYRLTMEDVD